MNPTGLALDTVFFAQALEQPLDSHNGCTDITGFQSGCERWGQPVSPWKVGRLTPPLQTTATAQ